MARKIALNTLSGSTMDILNVIRQNASLEYQESVPVVETEHDIPKVGEIIYGTPAFANQFINALVNRIALVRANSAIFNNPYSRLKKGYLEFGETVEEIFVNIARVVHFDVEDAPAREFKRTLPDVGSVFHVMNWRVLYPITIQDEDLKRAFLSIDGVTSLIAKIVDSIYTAAEYDEFLLFKYMLIKGMFAGSFKLVAAANAATTPETLKNDAALYRGTSNKLTFMSSEYNEAKVKNTTPKGRQLIFMPAEYNAYFDVNVLASAFNMDKAEFMGSLYLIDDFTTFDNDRWEVIRSQSDGLEEVTQDELTLMEDVVAMIIDEEWFQIYDNLNKMTEKYVASGLYWNYFYHSWKTISHSPFHNAIAFVRAESLTAPEGLVFGVDSISVDDNVKVITFVSAGNSENEDITYDGALWIQTEALTEAGIAVQKYGALIIPSDQASSTVTLTVEYGDILYTASVDLSSLAVGGSVTLEAPEE